jgi:hypothetical protein
MVIFFISIVIIAVLMKSPWFKGVMGEFVVNVAAKLMLDKNEYHLIKNVTLPTEEGTTQIDHVIVSRYGIFVVETKNLKGWIFGNANQKTWTQQIFKFKNKFQNPLHQNYKHVKTLESLLGLKSHQIHSVIVFVGDSKFKTEMPDNVTHGFGYIRYIKAKTKPVLSMEEAKEIIGKIETDRLATSFKTNRNHIRYVKTIVNEKHGSSKGKIQNIAQTSKHGTVNSIRDLSVCKTCGSDMKIRDKKSGEDIGKKFWVCIKFPECRNVEPYLEANQQRSYPT